jgi:hypothetical protein
MLPSNALLSGVKDLSFKLYATSADAKFCDFVFISSENTGTNNVKQYSYKSGCFDGNIPG